MPRKSAAPVIAPDAPANAPTDTAALDPLFVSIREARRHLGNMSHSGIYELIRAKKLTLYKSGRKSILSFAEVKQLPRRAVDGEVI